MGYTAILSGLTIAPRMISSVIMIAAINSLMRVFYSRILISIGFLFLGISIFSYVNLNLQVSFTSIVIPQILMGFGIILVFVPVSALALGTLPKQELSAGASLHNLCKSTTMAVVASISSTLVARHAQMHQVYLVKNLSDFNLFFQQKFASLTHTFGASSTFANTKANMFLYKSLLSQSRLMAYVDVFAVFALLAFVLIPIPFLIKIKMEGK